MTDAPAPPPSEAEVETMARSHDKAARVLRRYHEYDTAGKHARTATMLRALAAERRTHAAQVAAAALAMRERAAQYHDDWAEDHARCRTGAEVRHQYYAECIRKLPLPHHDALAAAIAAAVAGAWKEAAQLLRDEADHLAADARDGVRNGSAAGSYEAGAKWVGWAAGKIEAAAISARGEGGGGEG